MLIGLGFLWTGTAYIAQAYRLLSLMDADSVSRITCGSYYLFQAAGICVVAWFFAKHPTFAGGRVLPFWSTIFALGCTAVSLYSTSLTVIIISGFLLNLAIGMLSGCYLTRLATNIPQQRRGAVFGFAYALGSIGTWLISLPMGGRFLWYRESFFAIIALAALTLPFIQHLSAPSIRRSLAGHPQKKFDWNLIILSGAVLLLLSMENTLGFSFPLKGASDSLYIEFVRIFYGVGLVIAGFVSDKNRRFGAICCLAALAFPFAALAHGNNEAGETLMWVLAYLFLGFFSVYRILLFSDISGKTGIPAFAVLGLMFGRLGEAAGTIGAGFFSGTPLIIISGAVFVLVIVLFFLLYQKIYTSVVSPEELEQQRFTAYSARFGFSAREQEIFALIIRGMSNAEIAAALYITESTVKFHIGNMFRKSGFARRSELITDYKLGSSH